MQRGLAQDRQTITSLQRMKYRKCASNQEYGTKIINAINCTIYYVI